MNSIWSTVILYVCILHWLILLMSLLDAVRDSGIEVIEVKKNEY